MKKLDNLLRFFNEHGYQAYGVGGCVRDLLLNREINDFDVATNATPDQMLIIFDGYPINTIGQRFGTIGVLFENTWFECTTFRTESETADYRHPEIINFNTNFESDVQRRDFTINALGYYQEKIIDYVNGLEDLNHQLIRAVGDPNLRFQEDALRMLRALRFVSEIGFTIEQQTFVALNDNIKLLEKISKERILQELKKLVNGEYLNFLITEYGNLLVKIFKSDTNQVSHQKYFVSRLMTIMPNISYKDLKLSRNEIKQIELIEKYKSININLTKLVNEYGYQNVIVLADYKNELIENITIKNLSISGYDLIQLGIEKEKRASLLKQLLMDVLDHKVENKRESLIERLNDLNDID